MTRAVHIDVISKSLAVSRGLGVAMHLGDCCREARFYAKVGRVFLIIWTRDL